MKTGNSFDITLYPLKALQELADVVAGVAVPSKKRLHEGTWKLIRGRNIVEDTVIPSDVFVLEEIVKKQPKAIIVPNDILISTLFGKYKIGIVPNHLGPSFIDSGIVRIRPKEEQKKYLVAYLTAKFGKSTVLEQLLKATRGDVIKFVTVSDIRRLRIPIFPLDILDGFNREILQKSPIQELKNVRLKFEQEIFKAIKSMLLYKGWTNDDIVFEKIISKDFRADIVLKRKDRLLAILEIKKDIKNTDSIIHQIQLMCKVANIPFGYLVSESGIIEIKSDERRLIERSDLPSPKELIHE
jgi:hypothetical protein